MTDTPPKPSPERGIHVFTIAGIRILIDYSWFVIFFLVAVSLSAGYLPQEYPGQSAFSYWTAGLVATLAFFFSILFHELAHSLVAMRHGITIPSITLFLFGGVSRLSEEPKDPKTELVIAVVGPLSSFLLALVFWLATGRLEGQVSPMVTTVLRYLAFINFALGVFNLVPGFPLDGGRVMRALWWWRTGSLERATRLASDMGKGFALALIFLGAVIVFRGALVGGIWLIFIGMFLRGSAEQGYQQMVLLRALENVTVGDVMVERPVTVPPGLSLQALVNDYFLRYGYRGFPVVEDDRAVGVVSVSSLQGVPETERAARTVSQVMHPLEPSRTIGREAPLLEALEKMAAPDVGRLLVVDDGRLEGLVTKTGLVRLLEMQKVLGTRAAPGLGR